MKFKNTLLTALLATFIVPAVYAADDGEDIEALAGKYLESKGIQVDEPVKADPASGFWNCRGAKIHMGVEMRAMQNLSNGNLYTITEEPSKEDNNNSKLKGGMNYLYSWTTNPAVTIYFVVDKSGKQLYLRDDDNFYKTYKCKRTS